MVFEIFAFILVILFTGTGIFFVPLGILYLVFDRDSYKEFMKNSRIYALKNGLKEYGYISCKKLQKYIVECALDDKYDYEIDSFHEQIRIFDKETDGENFLIILQHELILFSRKLVVMHNISYYYYNEWFDDVMLSMDIRGDTLKKNKNIIG